MKKLTLIISMMIGVNFVYANDIYIEQIGDGSTINITQDGTSNKIGDSTTPTFIGGGSNTVNLTQVGSSNQLDIIANGASTDVTVNTQGSNNTQSITCGTTSTASCSGSVIKQVVTGDSNTITQSLGAGANHNSEINVTGDSNTITHTSTNAGVTSALVSVTGDTNTIGLTQSGITNQSITINSTGSGNNVTVNQSN